jgi:hypothetical protein
MQATMMMPHPYRTPLRVASTASVAVCPHVCLRCHTSRWLASVPFRSVLVGVASVAFVMINAASAIVALSAVRMTERMVAAASTVAAAARDSSRPLPPPSSAPPRKSTPHPVEPRRDAAPPAGNRPSLWHFQPPHTGAWGIVTIAPGEFVVDRALVDEVLEQAAESSGITRAVPELRDGVVGVRVYGIRPRTILAALGFANGDLIQTINGWDVSSPERALEAYARLRGADELVVGLVRSNSQLYLRYHLR